MRCYQTGYVEHGVLTWSNTEVGPCPGGPPAGRIWFNVRVVARAHIANIFMDDRFILLSTPHHATRGAVGVVALNGQRSMVHFGRPQIVQTSPNYGQCNMCSWC